MIVYEELKTNRKLLNMTQTEVALSVGVSLMSYQLWERGVMKPSEENETKLRLVLKMGEGE